ncbi:MAG TPA: tRNA (adenine-N1)-methyltransferase [Aeromicrobium sp.]|nr:tRNA (adenine-N1)-methyltransferase [Aeromicrobium sp.]
MSRVLQEGEWVRITDAKGRRHNVRLEVGKEFSTKKGQLKHDDMIGQPEGTVLVSSLGGQYQVFRPLLSEYVVSMPRGSAIVYPKDAAHIVTMADIFPGARVVEAGVGSGALTLYLLRAVGPDGRVGSYEMRQDFAEIARRNVEQIAGGDAPWTLTVGDVREVIAETEIDRLILDMVDPWTCVPLAVERLVPGGIVCAYVATTTQLSLFVETLRADGGFTEPHAWETSMRDWHLEGLAVRPIHGSVGHTAFLVTARRMAPGRPALEKTRRPAPGAYGPDYTGPRPPGV